MLANLPTGQIVQASLLTWPESGLCLPIEQCAHADEAGASAYVPGRQLMHSAFPRPRAEAPLGQGTHADALCVGLANPGLHGVHIPSLFVEPKNDGGPKFEEMLLNPRPGAHEALVMAAQSPASEIWYDPASHWLIQQRDLIKLPEDEHGADVVSERELELHPRELHDLTDAVYGVIAASKTVIVAMVPAKTSEILFASAWK